MDIRNNLKGIVVGILCAALAGPALAAKGGNSGEGVNRAAVEEVGSLIRLSHT